MLPVFVIDHTSLAILLGEAQNSKSFAASAWGNTTYESLCERFYRLFENNEKINVESIKEELNKHKIKQPRKFDNFALEYIQDSLKEYASMSY